MTPQRLVVGTRNSALARAQTDIVVAQLRAGHPDLEVEVHPIVTEGDRSQRTETPLQEIAGQGVFVKELERALIDGTIDIAVHSLKDMTTAMDDALTIGAMLEREDPRDVLIASGGETLVRLPQNARIGTSSQRRTVQLRAIRPDIEFAPIRGNVDTRVRKAEQHEYDAIVLAAAGLRRLGLQDKVTEYFSPSVCLPDPGQGALAVQVRRNDERVCSLIKPLDHQPTRAAATAERAFLDALGGGCSVPIAALGTLTGNTLTLYGMVASEDAKRMLRAAIQGIANEPEALGHALAEKLRSLGADEVLT